MIVACCARFRGAGRRYEQPTGDAMLFHRNVGDWRRVFPPRVCHGRHVVGNAYA